MGKMNKETIEAVLKYTLHLDIEIKEQDELRGLYNRIKSENGDQAVKKFVEKIVNQALDSCRELFYGNSEASGFLGANIEPNDGSFYKWLDIGNQKFWDHSIGAHCIIAGLDCMRQNYFEDAIKRYSFCSYAMDKGEKQILQNYIIKETGTWIKSIRTGQSAENIGNGSDYKKNFAEKAESEIGGEYRRIVDNNLATIPLKNVMGVSFIYRNRQTIRKLSKLIASKEKIASVEEYEELVKSLVEAVEADEIFTETDKILLGYRLEKYFGYVLAVQTVELSAELGEKLQGTLAPELFAEVLNLPNVYDRRLYLRYIMEGALNTSFEPNFFSKRKDDYFNMGYRIKECTGDLERWMNWQDLVRKFIYYMVRFLFPIAENSFLALFLSAIEMCSGQSDEKLLLWDAMEVLDQYLEQNGPELLEKPYTEYCKDRKWHHGSLDEKAFRIWNLDITAYKGAERAKQKEYDIFLKKLLLDYYEKNDGKKRPFDEKYFECREKHNVELYKKLGAIYMEMVGAK